MAGRKKKRPRKRTRMQQEANAYNEAGHAVASFWMRANLKRASIVPGDGYHGCTE